jgi:hypothetical protein
MLEVISYAQANFDDIWYCEDSNSSDGDDVNISDDGNECDGGDDEIMTCLWL